MSDEKSQGEIGFVRGSRRGNGKSYATDEELKRKKWEDEYHKSQGATGIAGAGKRSNPEYKKKQEEAWKKASASGWGNQ